MISAQTVSTRIEVQSPPASAWLVALLAVQTFCAFLTDTRLIETIQNNLGAFEVSGIILCGAMFVYFGKHRLSVRMHPVIRLLDLIVLVAAVSTLKLTPAGQLNGVVHLLILIFMLIFILSVYNWVLLSEQQLVYLLRFFAYSAAIAAVWVIVDGIMSGGSIAASGPLRNRAHVGIYMLTSLWLVLMYTLWPNTSRKERWILYGILALILYCVAVSGRRSVYLSLILGLAGLAVGFIVAYGRGRFKIIIPIMLAFITLSSLYFVVSAYWFPASFFKTRIGMVAPKVQRALGPDDPEEDESFVVLQREAALRAFSENPILGIGWGGFSKSGYSPTGHEMHSTPLRFLAETGFPGFLLYVLLMIRVLWGGLRVWLLVRKTSYQLPALILCVALWSLSVSHFYNRSVTERTFWILLVIFLGFETLMLKKLRFTPRFLARR
jgi:O-antigen ligase